MAADLIRGKLDFFTGLYDFMDHSHPGLRTAACLMFIQIM